MRGYILGIDIGANSLGYAVLSKDRHGTQDGIEFGLIRWKSEDLRLRHRRYHGRQNIMNIDNRSEGKIIEFIDKNWKWLLGIFLSILGLM
tara:strand:+ start:1693 stop:1962 length:270 start_codon:yes stop_codon:yes gene_type:complete